MPPPSVGSAKFGAGSPASSSLSHVALVLSQCRFNARSIRLRRPGWTAGGGVSSASRLRLGPTALPDDAVASAANARYRRVAGRRGISSFDRSVPGRTTRARPRRHAKHGGQRRRRAPPGRQSQRPREPAPACRHPSSSKPWLLVALVGVALLAFRLSSGPIYLEWLHDKIVVGHAGARGRRATSSSSGRPTSPTIPGASDWASAT